MSSYSVKWKGRTSGPFSLDELRKLFEEREIGGMHEVLVDDKWITVRSFFRNLAPVDAPTPVQAQPPLQTSPARTVQQPQFPPPPPPPHLQSIVNPVPTVSSPSYAAPRADPLSESVDLLVFAGFWTRVTASVIDAALLVGLPLLAFDLFLKPGLINREYLVSLTPHDWVPYSSGFLVVCFLYFVMFESSTLSGTPGKWCLGLRVLSGNGRGISFSTAALRFAWKVVASLMGFIGLFLAAFSARKQALHDLMTGTFVCSHFESDRIFNPENRTL